jgi:hypothetical protein
MKRSILTTIVSTKALKSLNLEKAIFFVIWAYFYRFWIIFARITTPKKVR